MIARLLGRRIVKRFVGDAAMARIDNFYERHLDDWKSLLAARLLLFSVYDFISYAVGLGHIRLSVYVIVSFIGGLIPTYIFVAIGSEAAQNQDILLVFYIGAALLFVVWLLFRRQINRLWAKNSVQDESLSRQGHALSQKPVNPDFKIASLSRPKISVPKAILS